MKIVIKKINGLVFCYLALFGYFYLFEDKINIYHRKINNKISRKAESYFKEHSLNLKIIDFFDLVFKKYRNIIGEETLGYLSLLYDYPQKTKEIQKILKEEKNIKSSLFKKLKNQLLKGIHLLEISLKKNSSFLNYLNYQFNQDIAKKKKLLKKLKTIIQQDLKFFGATKSSLKKIIITPFNYFPFQAASLVYILKDSIIIISSEKFHPEIIEHEFLHSIINPLVRSFIKKNPLITKKIQKFSSPYRRKFYKNNSAILLSEALIYSYINFKNKKPLTYQYFLKLLPFKDNDQFKSYIKKGGLFKKKCELLKINSFNDFLNKSSIYYSLFVQDNLRNKLYNFYQHYFREKTKNRRINFEYWFNNNIYAFLQK